MLSNLWTVILQLEGLRRWRPLRSAAQSRWQRYVARSVRRRGIKISALFLAVAYRRSL